MESSKRIKLNPVKSESKTEVLSETIEPLEESHKTQIVDYVVKSIQYGIYSAEDIKRMSVVEINNPELYDSNGKPKSGGVLDLKMGPLSKGAKCQTCLYDLKNCTGHFGHITLSLPVLHYCWIQHYLLPILECVCFRCGKLRVC